MKKAEVLLHRLYDNAPLPTIVLSEDLSTLWLNEAAKLRYPVLSLPHSIGLMLSLEQNELLPGFLSKGESFSLPIGASGIDLIFLPCEACWVAQLVPTMGWDCAAVGPEGMQRVLAAINAGLRLPLSRIFSSVSALARRGDVGESADLLQFADAINQGGYQLLRFTQDLTSYLRCLYGSEPPSGAPFDLNLLLSELAPAAAMMTQKVKIPLEAELLGKSAVIILGDADRLVQALLQILSNSCRYTRPGNRILLRLETRDGFAVITISDRGAGIPAERLAHVSKPFCSWDPDGLPGMGTGLGLTVAQYLISLHRGTMAITSQEGEGTTVAIRLPLSDSKAPLRAVTESADYLRDRFSPLQVILSDSCGAPRP